jgi:catechol 2,3-dioxygenase-like lactoylglutathione lyase family enzyme
MNLRHVALVCSSLRNADIFFGDLLGLRREGPKELPAEIAEALFGVSSPLSMVNYRNESAHFEVFIHGPAPRPPTAIEHACLEVESLERFLAKCRALNVRIIQVPKGASLLTFVRDFDGNLFEMKEAPSGGAP